MALVLSQQTSRPLLPEEQLIEAIGDFQGILTDDQRTALRKINSIPDADAVLVFTAELDYSSRHSKGRSIATRLHSVLQSVREFSAVIDTFVSSHPEVAALIWGSVKLTIQIAINFTSYYEALSNLFMGFATHCPRFAEYQALYPTSARLQTALCNFHASIIRCCERAIKATQRTWTTQLRNALWQSVEQEFEPDIKSVQRYGKEVRREIELAKAQADRQDQELRKQESEATAGYWHRIRDKLSSAGTELETIKQWQVQQDIRRSGERRRQLLDSLSSYEYLAPFKRACKARHCNTAEWLFQTAEFRRWKEATVSSWIWCSGKIGSGKTILLASAVNHVLAHKNGMGEIITFFFPQFDDPQSLCAETVIRSIIRQSIDPMTLSDEIEADLVKLDQTQFTRLDMLNALLRKRIAQSKMFYIFIDALDEFEAKERRTLLDLLVSLGSGGSPGLRVFLSGRESLSGELKGKIAGIERVSMAFAQANVDISLYIEEALQEKMDHRDLVVRDQSLILDINQALVKHADGMFLWVAFLIEEICAQRCDDDIRDAIGCLPKTLTETFDRALLRIVSRGNAQVAAKPFSWVAIAKRHLTLDELCEAISTKVGQPYSDPGRMVNGIEQLATWCENIVHIDEELKTIQFAHQAIHKFIVDGPRNPQLTDFCFNLADADHHAGEICVTYLNFNDFKTTLARRPQPVPVHPVAMAKLALTHHSKVPSSFATRFNSRHHKGKAELDVVVALAGYQRGNEEALRKLQQSHPFLKYASMHWISHAVTFQAGKSLMWEPWYQIVTCGHDLANRPWPEQQEFNALDADLLDWSLQSRHYALTRLIRSCGGISEPKNWERAWSLAAEDVGLLDVLLEDEHPPYVEQSTLRKACKVGNLAVVDRLLTAGANVNSVTFLKQDESPLQVASRGGHRAIVERLLTAGADVNAAPWRKGRTALQAACEGGHRAVIERLLEARAKVNAEPAEYYGRTALQAASGGGHPGIVERLLIAGANAYAEPARVGGRTALQAASEGGHLVVIERLVKMGADVNADPANLEGRTALQAAAEAGHLAVVKRLLGAGANVDAGPATFLGRTAVQAASGGGHLAVVKRLLGAGASVHANPAAYYGRTALQAASEGGHLAVVERLLEAGAVVNADAGKVNGLTALQAASEGGHLAVVERLLEAGADVDVNLVQAASERGHAEVYERLRGAYKSRTSQSPVLRPVF